MNPIFEPAVAIGQLKLPPQDIELLTFCKSNKAPKVEQWAQELKLTQVTQTSISLYECLPEINHLKTDAITRFDMLEALWRVTQECTKGLAKDFLQQPLILPPSAQKTALVAQSLQKYLLDGYTLCMRDLTKLKKLKPHQLDTLIACLYRACLCIDAMFFRCYQLYSQAPTNMWRQLHAYYQIAEFYEVVSSAVPSELIKDTGLRNIQEAYLHAISLASIRPNQLSQNDINASYEALFYWVKHIQIHSSGESSNDPVFLINLSNDLGPAHKSRFHCEQFDRVLEINFDEVVNQLNKLQRGPSAPIAEASITPQAPPLPAALQVHISECWRQSPERLKTRKRAEVHADVCVGLIDSHHQICGGIPFSQFLDPEESTDQQESFLSGGFDSLVNSMSKPKDIDADKPKKQPVARVTIQNVSAGGYCIKWQGALGNRVEAGELIAVKEDSRRSWSLGVIRWIRKLKNGSQLGVQLLTTQPVPYGASFMYDMGGYSDYMRAMHIPAPTSSELPPCLLTASIPFQEDSRVRLKQEDTEVDVRLTKCVLSTSRIRLFAFETLSAEM